MVSREHESGAPAKQSSDRLNARRRRQYLVNKAFREAKRREQAGQLVLAQAENLCAEWA